MYSEFSDFAKRLAEASAQIIMQYFRTDIAVDPKSDGSPVTIADRKAEEVMRAMIMKEFPTHGIFGEEFGHYQSHAEYQWTLDPIDGTQNFVAGGFLFGTQISLLIKGEPILGVINFPVANQFLIGCNGETYVNNKKVHVRPCYRIEDATLLSSGFWDFAKYHRMAGFEALTRRARLYRTWGDCHGYYLVATGFADINIDAVMKIWDIMPLIPIFQGAGGKITDWYGNNVIGGKGLVATAGVIHDTVIQVLNSKSGR